MKNYITILFNLFNINNIQKPIKNMVSIGIKISFILMLFSVLILSLYLQYKAPNYLFDIGSNIFKSSSIYIVMLIIYGICFNKITNDLHINLK